MQHRFRAGAHQLLQFLNDGSGPLGFQGGAGTFRVQRQAHVQAPQTPLASGQPGPGDCFRQAMAGKVGQQGGNT